MSYTIIRDEKGNPTGLNVNWSSISGDKVSLREAELLTRLGEEAAHDTEAIFREMASALETSRELLDFAVSVAKTGNEQASEALDQRNAAYKERDEQFQRDGERLANMSRQLVEQRNEIAKLNEAWVNAENSADKWCEIACGYRNALQQLRTLFDWSKAGKRIIDHALSRPVG